jgi:hypothetical protein
MNENNNWEAILEEIKGEESPPPRNRAERRKAAKKRGVKWHQYKIEEREPTRVPSPNVRLDGGMVRNLSDLIYGGDEADINPSTRSSMTSRIHFDEDAFEFERPYRTGFSWRDYRREAERIKDCVERAYMDSGSFSIRGMNWQIFMQRIEDALAAHVEQERRILDLEPVNFGYSLCPDGTVIVAVWPAERGSGLGGWNGHQIHFPLSNGWGRCVVMFLENEPPEAGGILGVRFTSHQFPIVLADLYGDSGMYYNDNPIWPDHRPIPRPGETQIECERRRSGRNIQRYVTQSEIEEGLRTILAVQQALEGNEPTVIMDSLDSFMSRATNDIYNALGVPSELIDGGISTDSIARYTSMFNDRFTRVADDVVVTGHNGRELVQGFDYVIQNGQIIFSQPDSEIVSMIQGEWSTPSLTQRNILTPSSSPPEEAEIGDIWYDTSVGEVKILTGHGNWSALSSGMMKDGEPSPYQMIALGTGDGSTRFFPIPEGWTITDSSPVWYNGIFFFNGEDYSIESGGIMLNDSPAMGDVIIAYLERIGPGDAPTLGGGEDGPGDAPVLGGDKAPVSRVVIN